MSALGAPEGWHQHWKPKTLVRNFCTPAGLCASSIKSRHPERWSSRLELLHGQSLCSHIDSETQCLGASSQPWQNHSIREDFPCCFTVSPCQYSNKPGCNGWNKLSCLCLCEGGKRYELQAGRSPSNLISFSKSCSLFGHNFTTLFISTPFIFLIYFFCTLLTASEETSIFIPFLLSRGISQPVRGGEATWLPTCPACKVRR